MKRYLSLLLILAVTVSLLTGCGSSAPALKGEAMYDNAVSVEPGYAEAPKEDGSLTSSAELDSTAAADRKLIKTVRLSAETETYDPLIEGIAQTIAELGGYVETREVSGSRQRNCTMTIRIPAESLELFVTHVRENANVISSSETAEDVTLEYVDTEAKITALETEQARLLELLAQAADLEDILAIEARLSDVTYELERYASRLRTLSNLVTYATVHLSIREVEVLTPVEEPTVWQRISTGFADNLSDLGDDLTNIFVWVITGSPYLVFWGLVIGLIVGLIVRSNKKRPRVPKKPPTPPTTT